MQVSLILIFCMHFCDIFDKIDHGPVATIASSDPFQEVCDRLEQYRLIILSIFYSLHHQLIIIQVV